MRDLDIDNLHTGLLDTPPTRCHLLPKLGELVYLLDREGEQRSLPKCLSILTSLLLASSRAASFLC